MGLVDEVMETFEPSYTVEMFIVFLNGIPSS